MKYAATIDLGHLKEAVSASVAEGFPLLQALDIFMRQMPSMRCGVLVFGSTCAAVEFC